MSDAHRTIERKVKPTYITKAQYMQLIGLRAVMTEHEKVRAAIEKAAYAITNELDHDGTPALCGHTTDWLFGSRSLDEMLSLVHIKVKK